MVIAKYFSESGSAKLTYSNKPFLFSIGGLELSIFVPLGLILLVISYLVLYKTRFGLRLRACGEHPQAADSVGVNVYKMRYAGVLLSGALGAIGGMAYVVPPVQTWNFEVGVTGAGFLALAVMIFGQWKPMHICGAAMFFAVFKSLANIADSTFLAQEGEEQKPEGRMERPLFFEKAGKISTFPICSGAICRFCREGVRFSLDFIPETGILYN